MPTKEYSECDISTWVYKKPVKNKRGGLNGYVDVDKSTKSNPTMQFPKCRVPFAVSEKKADAGEYARRNVELSADDPAFLKWIEALDERNVNVAAEQSEEWFKKKLSAEALSQTLYRACAQPGKEPGKFAPLVRVKVAESGDKPTRFFTVYKDANGDEKYRKGTIDDINKNCHVVCKVEVAGLWFVSKGFGMTFNVKDILIWPNEEEEDDGCTFVGVSVTKGDDNDAPPAKRARTADGEEGGKDGAAATDAAASTYGAATGGYDDDIM